MKENGHLKWKKKLKYAVLDKEKQEITIFNKKSTLAEYIGVSRKTIYRNIQYENSGWKVFLGVNVL